MHHYCTFLYVGMSPPPSYHTTPPQLYPELLHKTHISLRVASILKDWATALFSIKEIPRCYYNSELASPDLEDLRLSIDLYTPVITIIRMSAWLQHRQPQMQTEID
jgi:hypothetical protein